MREADFRYFVLVGNSNIEVTEVLWYLNAYRRSVQAYMDGQVLVMWISRGTWSMLRWKGAKSGLFLCILNELLHAFYHSSCNRLFLSCREVSCCPPPPVSLAEHSGVTDAISVLKAAKTPLVIIGKGNVKKILAI